VKKIHKNSIKIIFPSWFNTGNLTRIAFFIYIVCMIWQFTIFARLGDINFSSDIARDFHLFREIDEKKIILIGPRSSTTGLFHGPLWIYLTYPGYILSHGDAAGMTWYWVGLGLVFLIGTFFITRKIFGEWPAWLYTSLLANRLTGEMGALFNPHGAFFIMPYWLSLIIYYFRTYRLSALVWFIFMSGLMIQFQMAVGVPLLIAASIPIIYSIFRRKNYRHLLAFLLLLIPLVTYVIFEFRHNFLMTKSALNYILTPTQGYQSISDLISDRFFLMIGAGLEIFIKGTKFLDLVSMVIILISGYFSLKTTKDRKPFLILIFLYISFFFLSTVNRSGGIMWFYRLPLIPMVLLFFAISICSMPKIIAYAVTITILFVNLYDSGLHWQSLSSYKPGSVESWKTLRTIADDVFSATDEEFGYFVYSPDTLAYQMQYAMAYKNNINGYRAVRSKKMPLTVLVISPPPPDKPEMSDNWWKENKLRMVKEPTSTKRYPNGYRIEWHELTPEDIAYPPDPTIDPGIYFR